VKRVQKSTKNEVKENDLVRGGNMDKMRMGIYKRMSQDKKQTKFKKVENNKVVAKAKKKSYRKSIASKPKKKINTRNINNKKNNRFKKSAGKRNKSQSNFKFILDNHRPNKKKFMSNLEREYKKKISAFQKMENKFKKFDDKNKKAKETDAQAFDRMLNEGELMKSFHMDIVEDMDKIISQNDEIRMELSKKKTSSMAITVRQKEFTSKEEKKNKIKKDFGQWFTEDYFENCLKLEGEFGIEEPGRDIYDAESEKGREQQIHEIRRDFAKKNVIEEIQDSCESKKIISLNVSSNEKLPLTFSNGYTISNKRNKFGRKLKRLLELRSRHFARNCSERNEFKYRSRINFDENSSSVQLTMFFNRLRLALNYMKKKEESEGQLISKRSKSCNVKTQNKDPEKSETQNQKLRGIYLNKKLGRNRSCIKEWKNSKDSVDKSDGIAYIT
jgi:hypothetical protein